MINAGLAQRLKKSRAVTQVSNRALSAIESEVINKDLKFTLAPKNPPILDIVRAIEEAATKLPKKVAAKFR